MADAGDLAAAEAALHRADGARLPRFAPRVHAALGRTRGGAATAHLDDAVSALGRAVDLDSGDAADVVRAGRRAGRAGARRAGAGRAPARADAEPGSEPAARAPTPRWGGSTRATGQWTAALRSSRKALELGGQQETDRVVALRLRPHAGRRRRARGDRVADARGARPGAPTSTCSSRPPAATSDDALAERLLREGLARSACGSAAARRAGRPARPPRAQRRGDRDRRGVRRRGARRRRRAGGAARDLRRRRPRARGLRVAAERGARRASRRRWRRGWRWRSPPAIATRSPRWPRSRRPPATAPTRELHGGAARVRRSHGRRRRAARGWGASRPTPPRARSWRAPARRQPPPAGQLAGLLTWTHDSSPRPPRWAAWPPPPATPPRRSIARCWSR